MQMFVVEALTVGVMTAVVGSLVSLIFMLQNPEFVFEKYTFWPQVAWAYFFTGVLIHFMCEGFGLNRWYCKNGHACQHQ